MVIAPMWTIRTRMMTQTNHEDYRNSFHAIRKIYQTEGLYALYRGLIPSMLGLVRRHDKKKDKFIFINLKFHTDSCRYSISNVRISQESMFTTVNT